MSGIPDHARGSPATGPDTPIVPPTGGATGGGSSDLEMLRRHPQLNDLRRLVQANPASLSQVLEAIGQQNPDLLRLIHANQAAFLAMMNEPITDTPTAGAGGAGAGGQMAADMGGMGGEEGGMPNPVQMLQMLQMLPPDQREAAAQSLGMTAEQLQAFSQMVSQLPPEQLQRLMGDAARAQGGIPPGANVVRLTDEEMAAVTRLTELGFDQQDAVAAYLACDKNEALAANLLLEGWSAEDGGGGF